jgi:hypothetical protein
MADLPPYSGSSDDTGGSTTTGRPRWVYAVGIIVIVLILLMVVLHLAGGGLAGLHKS